MRAETLLWAANAAGLIVPAVPWRGGTRHLRHIAVLAPLAAFAQAVVDGYRWPMVPAYALSMALAVVWALGIARAGVPSRGFVPPEHARASHFSRSRWRHLSRSRCSSCRNPVVRTRSAP